jgi:nucleotide-binding universal stress UspA family protein
MPDPIVAGVDGSRQSRAAAAVAARLARALDRKLVLVHAAADPSRFLVPDGRERARQRRRTIEQGFALLEGTAATLREPVGRTAVVLGIPAEALVSFCLEERAELLVVGSRGRSRLAAALLGSVSACVTSADGCPVVVVPPNAADRFLAPRRTGVVCALDGSAESVRAAQVGRDFAERLGLEPVTVHVDEGDAADGLRRRSLGDDCRLIVVGSHGRGGLRRALLGSVSRSLAAAAPVPVLVVPPTARPSGWLDAGVTRPGARAGRLTTGHSGR